MMEYVEGHLELWARAGRELLTPRATIGSSDAADIAEVDSSVSRVHALLEWRGGSWFVVRARPGLSQRHVRQRRASTICLAFAPDGHRLAAALENNVVRIVDVEKRSIEDDYIESVDVPFFTVAWASQGNRLATGGTVQLWNAVTLQPAAAAGKQSPMPVCGLAFSPDGAALASTTECTIAGRDRTRNEWARYLPGHAVRSTCTR